MAIVMQIPCQHLSPAHTNTNTNIHKHKLVHMLKHFERRHVLKYTRAPVAGVRASGRVRIYTLAQLPFIINFTVKFISRKFKYSHPLLRLLARFTDLLHSNNVDCFWGINTYECIELLRCGGALCAAERMQIQIRPKSYSHFTNLLGREEPEAARAHCTGTSGSKG